MITKDTPEEEVIREADICNRCGKCCSVDSGYLADDDFKKIADFLGKTVDELKDEYLETFEKFNKTLFKPKKLRGDKQYGKCIFLIDDLCSIQEVKPLYCRLVNCGPNSRKMALWFDLNYVVDENDPESIRQYASYLKFGPTLEGGKLKDLIADEETLKKILDYEIIK